MVVMDLLDETYQDLDDSPHKLSFHKQTLEKITALHQAGFVHGDVYGANILVRKSGEGEIMLVDFDWGGRIEEVRYSMNVNRFDFRRPAGALDGELILAEHDIEMVGYIFDKGKGKSIMLVNLIFKVCYYSIVSV